MNKPAYGNLLSSYDWGCDFQEVIPSEVISQVKVCYVKVSDLQKISEALAAQVQDSSWMSELETGVRRSYRKTVAETAAALVDVFNKAASSNAIGSEFGEVMVSIASSQALMNMFGHCALPIAELWKPQIKQNEGFDFHTVCPQSYINFGEAKFSSVSSPHGNAIHQAKGFVDAEKHLRDRSHLVNLVSTEAVRNLDMDDFGVVAAFSVNGQDPLLIFKNAIDTVKSVFDLKTLRSVYLVGVSH